MKPVFLFVILLSASAVAVSQVATNLVTSSSFDKIRKNTTFTDLKKLYGNSNVIDEQEWGPEGIDSFIVTKIFKGTSKEMMVFWDEKNFHKKIVFVETYAKGSPYKTMDGLKIGTTLDKLVKVNGKRISFYGFSWDYGGTISSFNSGKLDKSNVHFSLGTEDMLPGKLLGDTEISSDMPLVKKNYSKIFISKISVSFN